MTVLEQHWPRRLASQVALRERLTACYSAPHRGYHDTRHLAEVLQHLDELLAQPEAAGVDREAVALAAWFHDSVYDGQPDDEERSAALAETTLAASDVPRRLVEEVARLVRLTREHHPGPDDLAGQVLCDADLAILAAGRERYDEYVRDVRAEYAHLDDATFRAGRAQVLEALMAKPELFHTRHARDAWELAARTNVRRELTALGHERPS
jgi:predicted metal-dependent HD superfamily phosphohydrolase